jgi:transposase-like protein
MNLEKATKDICREHGISAATFYQWKQKYGGWMRSILRTQSVTGRECPT